LGITLLSEKAETLREQIKTTKDLITEETLRINAVKSSNEKISQSIDTLRSRQRAWQLKKTQDIERLIESIDELEQLNIEKELESHDKLSNWTTLNSEIASLNKQKSTLGSALLRADSSIEKIMKDINDLADAMCFTCGQALHADKKAAILSEKEKELTEAVQYQDDVAKKLTVVEESLFKIGDINGKPNTFYETAKEAYDHRSNVDSLKSALSLKQN
jgi:chromosome segregation ATPase